MHWVQTAALMRAVCILVLLGVAIATISYAQQPPMDAIDAVQARDIQTNERAIDRNTAAISELGRTINPQLVALREAFAHQSGVVYGFGLAITAMQFGIFFVQWRKKG